MTYKMLILDTKEELVAKGIQRIMKLRENNSYSLEQFISLPMFSI